MQRPLPQTPQHKRLRLGRQLVHLELLLPNELQTYLRHSTFRKDRGNGTPKSEEQELKNLQKAIEATL
ncbi:hypothetical protein D3C72_2543280 [compost metagenome]